MHYNIISNKQQRGTRNVMYPILGYCVLSEVHENVLRQMPTNNFLCVT